MLRIRIETSGEVLVAGCCIRESEQADREGGMDSNWGYKWVLKECCGGGAADCSMITNTNGLDFVGIYNQNPITQ
jgi:hypothetical protein